MTNGLAAALFRAALVCVIASVIGSVALAVAFRAGAQFTPNVDWNKIGSMPYNDAAAYLMERTLNLSAWEAFVQAAPNPLFWIEIAQFSGVLFVFSFACAAISLWWSK